MNYIVFTAIGLGGALGAMARYALSTFIYQKYLHTFPWGIFIVNVLGCFLVGMAYVLGTDYFSISPNIRLFIMVGFLGAFTTFSTFSLETLHLLKDGHIKIALSYGFGSLFFCMLAVWLGVSITQALIR